jgi:hypothetical protein
MVHVTCDLCGRELRAGEDQRYKVKIEITAVQDPDRLTEDDLDEDDMEAVSELLMAEECGLSEGDLGEPARQTLRYDLCPTCRKKFAKDPLNRQADIHFDFSEN